MLSTKEIKKLTEYQVEVFKYVFVTKEDYNGIKESLNILQSSVDGLSKDNQKHQQEFIIFNHRIKNLEDFTEKAAPKLGLKFKH